MSTRSLWFTPWSRGYSSRSRPRSSLFDIQNWVVRLVVLLLIVGFPIALVCSWACELTPEGIKCDGEVDHGRSITRKTGRRVTALIVIVAALAAGVTLFPFLHSERATAPEKQTPPGVEIDSKPEHRQFALSSHHVSAGNPALPYAASSPLPYLGQGEVFEPIRERRFHSTDGVH